tara:strand:- start:612 stop:2297 length:1686 start_codon:yes stop_codon:yes gene_type:complete
MADRLPLIVDSLTSTIKELPVGDDIDVGFGNIKNVNGIGATSINITGVATIAQLVASGVDLAPITEVTNYYVATNGDDVNGDGSAGSPWATPHRAIDFLSSKRLKVTEGFPRVTINVGVGTYNFGLNQTAAGSGYITGNYAVSGGNGTGAVVGISTVGSATGAVTGIRLLDPGTDYTASDTLGINTTTGTGCAFEPFHVGSSGEILGALRLNHPDGNQIVLAGADVTGTRPGRRGNHFYNQMGATDGSDPSAYTFSGNPSPYDASSPAGAYPNPMADGRANTLASYNYNRDILQAYYNTELYFYGSDGVIFDGHSPIKFGRMALFGIHANGERFTNDQNIKTSGIGNASVVGLSTEGTPDSAIAGQYRGGNISLSNKVSVHGFVYGFRQLGGISLANDLTVTNTGSVGVIADSNCAAFLNRLHSLNNHYHAVYSYGGVVYAYSGSMSNNGSYGVLNYYNGWCYTGNTTIDTVGFGNSTIIANNQYNGVHAYDGGMVRCDGIYNQYQYVYNNGSAQLYARRGGIISADNSGSRLVVLQGNGNATLYSPSVNTIGNNNGIINQ